MATAAPPPLQPHSPPPTPSIDLSDRENIEFRHPGYGEPTNRLLSLPRVDLDSRADTIGFGVHHRTALVACQIIAGNAFNTGRLTTDREGRREVSVPLDGVLVEAEYYFIIDGLDQYPIVPRFQDWEFPHGRIPDFWPKPPISINLASRCAITNVSFAIKGAHLVPREEGLWYNRNGMSRYGSGLGDIDNAANTFPLRRDLHRCFDDRWFAIIPKTPDVGTTVGLTNPSPAQYITHILSKDAAELWPEYHHIIVQSLHGESRPYLFARFAWAVLLRVKPFITAGLPRHVIRVHISNKGNEPEYKADHLNGPQLQDLYGGGGSKAATPMKTMKRKLGIGSEVNYEEASAELYSEDSDMEDDGFWNVEDDRKKNEKLEKISPVLGRSYP